MKYGLRVVVFVYCAVFLFSGLAYADDNTYHFDFDVDGILDKTFVKKNEISSNSVLLEVKILFSSGAESVQMSKELDEVQAMNFGIYLWRSVPGIIVLSYTNTSTRQASDFSYAVYKWVREFRKLCLYSQAYGVPPDQLAGEMYDSIRFVRLYDECVGLDEKAPAEEISDEDYYKKSLVFSYISANKARLYNSANDNDKSKMYLIKGDKVKVIDYKYLKSSGTDWFLIEYQAEGKPAPITKWIRGESVEPYVR